MKRFAIIILITVSNLSRVDAQLRVPSLISDGMILQRNTPLRIWGWGVPHEYLSLHFKERTYSTLINKQGKWEIQIPPQPAGGPYAMLIESRKKIEINDIYIGEVWLASGQSNMELTLERARPLYAELIPCINNPLIRQFEVKDDYNFNQPQQDLAPGRWIKATHESILKFTAVGYFFAAEINEKYKIPIGIINAAVGGSPAEAWLSEEAIRKFEDHYNELVRLKDSSVIRSIEKNDALTRSKWYDSVDKLDPGLKEGWKFNTYNDDEWEVLPNVGFWPGDSLIARDGSIWFRKWIEISPGLAGQKAELDLGRIIDADSVFINGQFIGNTSYQYPPRRYKVAMDVLREGRNLLTIRVINEKGRAGFVRDKPYELRIAGTSIDLSGEWKHRMGAPMRPMPEPTFIRWKPAGLFNAMIAPLTRYAIKGILWYQGESNTDDAKEYGKLMRELIIDWRKKWKQKDLPFLVVQLPNYMQPTTEPVESGWAELRMEQLKLLNVPSTGMAVTIDLGEWNDIHPLEKKEVGRRLSLLARKMAYGEKQLVASGPLFKSVEKEMNKLRIHFSNSSGLKSLDGQQLKQFTIAGADRKFVMAHAKIERETVVVWADEVANPVWVRYAWADNPSGTNLGNGEGLVASPFEGKAPNN